MRARVVERLEVHTGAGEWVVTYDGKTCGAAKIDTGLTAGGKLNVNNTPLKAVSRFVQIQHAAHTCWSTQSTLTGLAALPAPAGPRTGSLRTIAHVHPWLLSGS